MAQSGDYLQRNRRSPAQIAMPIVKIGLWAGRDKKTKKKLIENVTKAVCDSVKCPSAAVIVVLEDIARENWGQGGIVNDE